MTTSHMPFQRTTAGPRGPDSGQAGAEEAHIERRTQEIGRELLADARQQQSGVLSARFWTEQLMGCAMQDPAFKVQLFRFVDLFPCSARPTRCTPAPSTRTVAGSCGSRFPS
jgi:hypothetical protein